MKQPIYGYCPECNVQVELRETGSYCRNRPSDESVIAPLDPADIPYIVEVYSLCNCPKCESPFLVKTEWYEIPGEFETITHESEVIYPSSKSLPYSSLPNMVAKSYKNAIKSYEVGLYEPCLIMCRKCLEAICLENEITKGNLKYKLSKLKELNIIDNKLHSWADGLRLVGNGCLFRSK